MELLTFCVDAYLMYLVSEIMGKTCNDYFLQHHSTYIIGLTYSMLIDFLLKEKYK